MSTSEGTAPDRILGDLAPSLVRRAAHAFRILARTAAGPLCDVGVPSPSREPGDAPVPTASAAEVPRVVIEAVEPAVDDGRFAVKRELGDRVSVTADVFADGHDVVRASVSVCPPGGTWFALPMSSIEDDRWRASFEADQIGTWRYRVSGWVSPGSTWLHAFRARANAGVDVDAEIEIGARMLEHAAASAPRDAKQLLSWASSLRSAATTGAGRVAALAEDARLAALVTQHGPRSEGTTSKVYDVVVDSKKARFSTWYELFPRSASPDPNRPGTLADVEALLPELADLGIDVVYLPPVHPIGRTGRKGRNNSVRGETGDPGSPWAIGNTEGGHDTVAAELGGEVALRRLVQRASAIGIDVALDLAFQCSPDHPWVTAHPQWFRRRPDGSIQFAENPPKRYEDIYPIDFETADREALWEALRAVVQHWVDAGIRVFRVDNPHTKPFAFWEWLIADVKRAHPEVIFLAEAFTRPKVMRRLAKVGFSQSYTYFAWHNTAWELREYLEELTQGPSAEYLRPSLWVNTPDILTEYLQSGGRPAFATRLVLAATLGASYGVYGPAFELAVDEPREPGSEEYRDSEKYEVRHWDRKDPRSLAPLMRELNAFRRRHPALQRDDTLQFHDADNEMLLCYSKTSADLADVVLCVVNLDPHQSQSGWVRLEMAALGVSESDHFEVVDALSGERFWWRGSSNFVLLDPGSAPAHVFVVEQGR